MKSETGRRLRINSLPFIFGSAAVILIFFFVTLSPMLSIVTRGRVVELVEEFQHRLQEWLVTQQGVGLIGLQEGLVQNELLVPQLVSEMAINLGIKGCFKYQNRLFPSPRQAMAFLTEHFIVSKLQNPWIEEFMKFRSVDRRILS